MFQWFWRLLYESTPAEFRSTFGLEESVERLRAATKRSVFSSLGETAAVGKVSEQGVRLQPKGTDAESITGHIDFLQVRNGAVHILDYKPGARTDRPFAQLTIYALAQTRLVPG